MQALNLLETISSPSTTQTPSVAQSSESSESFLSVLLGATIGDESVLNTTLQSLNNSQLSLNAANSLDLDLNLSEVKGSLLENTDFMQVLSLLENFNGGKINKFPTLSNSLEKLLQTEQNINDLKGAKNLDDLIKIAQKLNLNLGNIEISNEDLDILKSEFKALNSMKFFDSKEVVLDEITKQKVSNLVKETIPKNENKPSLDKLIQNLDENSQKTANLKTNPTVNSDTNSTKITTLESKTNAPTLEDLLAQANNEMPTDQDEANSQKISAKQDETTSLKTQLNSQEKVAPQVTQTTSNLQNNMQNNVNSLVEQTIKSSIKTSEIKSEKTLQSTQNTNESVAFGSDEDESVDDYLENILKRARTNNADEKTAQSMQNTTSQASDNNEASEFTLDVSEPKNNVVANNFVKNAVASAKLVKDFDIRQTAQSFASDLAQKISEYKPPVTRFAMTLNPAELGEINVVMLTQANNLHVNITSNNQTMQLFFQNQNEFKQNLVNMGFTDVQMNFNSNSQGGGEQQRQRKNQARSAYDSTSEEALSENPKLNLEIILPRYI